MSASPVDKDKVTSWDYPYVESDQPVDENWTNALNKRSDWRYEPPDQEPEPAPPTAEEIEAIRTAAYEEGFAQGKQAGYQEGLQAGHEEGHEQGLKAGHQEGYEQGMQTGVQDVQTRVEQWQALLEQLHNPIAQLDSEVQRELIELSVTLARAVINIEVQSNKEILLQALSEGLKALPINETLYQIHLHPEDLVLIKEHFSDEEIEKHHWQFVEAPNMLRGGCDISTQNNAVDISVERRCRDVLDKFLLEQGLSR